MCRYFKQQDSAKRLQQEPVLSPTQALVKGPPPVRDLTMSLMENNLKQITLSTPALNSTQISSAWPQGPTVPIAPVPPATVTTWTGQNWRPAWQPASQFQLTASNVPINNMISQSMNGLKPAKPTKPLSSTEINDFLS